MSCSGIDASVCAQGIAKNIHHTDLHSGPCGFCLMVRGLTERVGWGCWYGQLFWVPLHMEAPIA